MQRLQAEATVPNVLIYATRQLTASAQPCTETADNRRKGFICSLRFDVCQTTVFALISSEGDASSQLETIEVQAFSS